MPPKKGGGGASKKTQEKAKNKVVEDKTFGLKNKNKSKKVGDYVKSVTSQVKGKNAMDLPPSFEDKQKKKEELERLRMEQDLFKPLIQQTKVPVGVDPKSVVCEFFKAGKCTKGDKCKFSHNLEVARKSDKIDLYTDRREKEEDTMDKWDQDKLEKVVDSKFVPKTEEAKKAEPKTQIVCKYFLEAIETKKYGWFWECPNGGTKCMYQHKLPPGFILKSVAKEMEKEEDETPLEDILEEKRKLLTTRTPLTLETFLKWKEDKKKERETNKAADEKKKESEGRTTKSMRSGREVFIYNPDLLRGDEEGEDVFDISELPTEEIDGPSIFIEATGTSIRTIVRGKGEDGEDGDPEIGDEEEENIKEGKEEEVDDSLFREEDIPDEDDEDEDDS